jgi:hypothetical protein
MNKTCNGDGMVGDKASATVQRRVSHDAYGNDMFSAGGERRRRNGVSSAAAQGGVRLSRRLQNIFRRNSINGAMAVIWASALLLYRAFMVLHSAVTPFVLAKAWEMAWMAWRRQRLACLRKTNGIAKSAGDGSDEIVMKW